MNDFLISFLKTESQNCKRQNVVLVAAEPGKGMSTCGTINVDFKLDEFEFTWLVFVVCIRDDLLLGCDSIDPMDTNRYKTWRTSQGPIKWNAKLHDPMIQLDQLR